VKKLNPQTSLLPSYKIGIGFENYLTTLAITLLTECAFSCHSYQQWKWFHL